MLLPSNQCITYFVELHVSKYLGISMHEKKNMNMYISKDLNSPRDCAAKMRCTYITYGCMNGFQYRVPGSGEDDSNGTHPHVSSVLLRCASNKDSNQGGSKRWIVKTLLPARWWETRITILPVSIVWRIDLVLLQLDVGNKTHNNVGIFTYTSHNPADSSHTQRGSFFRQKLP